MTAAAQSEPVAEWLHAVRQLLGMELGFVSQFADGRRVFRYVSAKEGVCSPIEVGGSAPLDESYCQRVVDGRLPELIHDACEYDEALKLADTLALPVGAHLSVPIRFKDGHVFGTLCCFSTRPMKWLTARDVQILRLFANLVGQILEPEEAQRVRLGAVETRIRAVITNAQYRVAYQPLVHVNSGHVVGHEALARFTLEPSLPPDQWFQDALAVGLQEELELAVLRHALREGLAHFPDGSYISVNVSPATLQAPALRMALQGLPASRIVLEMTEHESVEDYSAIARSVEPLRREGIRLAVDDAGAGYASFRHILQLEPDIIKLDRSLIANLVHGTGERALAAALVRFAEATGSTVAAEGVETQAQMDILRELQVAKAQGFLLGHPTLLSSNTDK